MEKLFWEMMKLYAGDPLQIQHFMKVHSFARLIGLEEKIDDATQNILEIAAIVHDIGIKPAMEKHGSGSGKYQELEGPPVARAMLENLAYTSDVIDRVCYLVGRHHTYTNIDGIDYQILIEADFLVNMFESEMSMNAIQSTLHKIFRTQSGKRYCQLMFNVV
ncbi:HD domain-containing protein [Desulfovibrio sp. OttesenSCG-928-G11]|nr:HD domain-containing protein [Desulfovibrio sp. OttesenSCG-928-G11]